VREKEVSSLRDFVGLVDRFVDGNLEYPLEWDDFISWENSNPGIETIRKRVADLEPLFFDGNVVHKADGISALVTERNQAAALAAMPAREIERRADE